MKKVQRAYEIYRKEGLISLKSSIVDFIKYPDPPYQKTRKEGTEARWEIISNNLDEGDASILDIGCNAGFITRKVAENGRYSIGIDKDESIYIAKQQSKREENVGFMVGEITPENIEWLPTFDVIFLLSVYHHWHKNFGADTAKNMLRKLADKAENKIFFEPPSLRSKYSSEIPPINDLDKSSIKTYNIDLLTKSFPSGTVEYLGGTSKGELRDGQRHLFMVNFE